MLEQPAPRIVLAQSEHLDAAKKLADLHKRELGFVNRAILQKAIAANELLVAPLPFSDVQPTALAGFAHFYVRRDSTLTLYSIIVATSFRGQSLGRRLFEALIEQARTLNKTQIRLKCPTELEANLFYERLGLEIVAVETGKLRPLNVWTYEIAT